MPERIRSLLVANRGEIAIRVMRAATELGIRTVAIYSQEDRFSLHRIKADESYLVGRGQGAGRRLPRHRRHRAHRARSAGATRSIPATASSRRTRSSPRPAPTRASSSSGPTPEIMRDARQQGRRRASSRVGGRAGDAGDAAAAARRRRGRAKLAAEVGYPVMLKASWGGGGRGMRVVESEAQLAELLADRAARSQGRVRQRRGVSREARARARGTSRCRSSATRTATSCTCSSATARCSGATRRSSSARRRRSSTEAQRSELCDAALQIGRAVRLSQRRHGRVPAGRRHRQVLLHRGEPAHPGRAHGDRGGHRHRSRESADPHRRGRDDRHDAESGVPRAGGHPRSTAHAMQCRVTTEDPENNFIPDYGRITAYRSPAGFGIRLDAGTAYAGAIITRFYDSLLVKVTAWAPTPEETIARMHRALWEFRVRGVATNLRFLDQLITHPTFAQRATTRPSSSTRRRSCSSSPRKRDRATRAAQLPRRGHRQRQPGGEGPRRAATRLPTPQLPDVSTRHAAAAGHEAEARRARRREVRRVDAASRSACCSPTRRMRDAHQSLLATRMRTHDMLRDRAGYAQPAAAAVLGRDAGAARRSTSRCGSCRKIRGSGSTSCASAMPNLLLQMLLRSANAVGYTNYPDNVVRDFVKQAAAHGIDLFRIFDSLNWVENMRVAIDAVRETGKLCEAAICYTGDISRPAARRSTTSSTTSKLAQRARSSRARTSSASRTWRACASRARRTRWSRRCKEEIGLPIHFHTHDTSGIAAASVLAAVDAGVDVVDGAIDAMSGLTSQPNLGSIVEALRYGPRDTGLDPDDAAHAVRLLGAGARTSTRRSRATCAPARPRSTCTACRAASTRTCASRRARSASTMRAGPKSRAPTPQVNELFGDIVKVTPSSKVVGDLALLMVTSGLTPEQVLDPQTRDRVSRNRWSQLFRGDLGQPHGGFPQALQKKMLQGRAAAARRGRATRCRRSISTQARAELQRKTRRASRPTTSSLRI